MNEPASLEEEMKDEQERRALHSEEITKHGRQHE